MSDALTQQHAAIHGRGNLLLLAGAGTGKTHTIIARCLRLVCEERVSLENLLLVTFTEAAAAEMRGRLRSELHWRLDLARSATGGKASLAEHLTQQAALLDTARISTLHGFCLQLLREHFQVVGLDPQFVVLDESQTAPLRREALDATLERYYAGADEPAQAVQSFIRTVGRGAEGRIRGLVTRVHAYAQSLPDPAAWLAGQDAHFAAAEPVAWRDLYGVAVGQMRDRWTAAVAVGAGNAPALRLAAEVLQTLPTAPDFSVAQAAVRRLRAADEKSNWPRGTVGRYRAPLESFFDEVAFLAELLPTGSGADPLQQDWDWARGHLRALLELTRSFAEQYAARKRELPGVDFADLEQFALQLLRHESIAREWRERLAYVFVDEYQDINAAQDAILTALSRSGPAANRFLVGDVKQSIYRFRRADPRIFQAYQEHWAPRAAGVTAEGTALSLTGNYRSREGLLNFINPLGAALMRRDIGGVEYEPLEFGAPAARAALRVKTGDAPCVELHLLARPEAEDEAPGETGSEAGPRETVDLPGVEREARRVVQRLRQLRDSGFPVWDKLSGDFRAVRWSDMAVLLRSPGGRAEVFAREFARAGVPLSAARDGFFASLEVSDLLCLLQLLDNPLQDLPLAAVLRSPLVGLSVEELVSVRQAKPKGALWLALREFSRREGAAPVVAREFLQRFRRWRERLRHTSLSQCLETALTETHYEAHLLAGERGSERGANVRQLLDLARQFDPYQRQGLYRFLRFVRAQVEDELDREPAAPPVAEAVRLLSIHKSKGLEYPVVVLAGLGTHFNETDLNQTILLHETLGFCPKITPPGAAQSYPALSHWLARRHAHRQLRGEELRLLYVALTRARDRLILIGTANQPADKLNWAASAGDRLDAESVAAARSPLDWLRQWLPTATRVEDWQDDRRGGNDLLTWEIVDGLPGHFEPAATTATVPATAVDPATIDADRLAALKARLEWTYPHTAALAQHAKTSVTELRRRAVDELDDEALQVFRPAAVRLGRRRAGGLSAAEAGTAHHRFLQHCDVDQTGSAAKLKAEAARLVTLRLLSREEAGVLDFPALAAFWSSDFGSQIRGERPHVRRELPFTLRLGVDELHRLIPAAGPDADLAGEFVIVQGVADLVVMRPEEIWLLDFKTDQMNAADLAGKVKQYAPQLQLYALAVSRIFRRPVTRAWLHFLAPGITAPIPVTR